MESLLTSLCSYKISRFSTLFKKDIERNIIVPFFMAKHSQKTWFKRILRAFKRGLFVFSTFEHCKLKPCLKRKFKRFLEVDRIQFCAIIYNITRRAE